MPEQVLKAPFPWFGGKSRAAHLVWDRFGDTPNYCEPFFGSGAVLLGRPHAPKTETVNDLDCMVANFWRALQHAPDEVARYADHPVNEADQHARHLWLCSQVAFRERMKTEPEFFDAKIAGWWVWGQCCWIGSGWCSVELQLPRPWRQMPCVSNAGKGVHRQLPHLGNAGTGVHRKLPHLGDANVLMHQRHLATYLGELAARLRRVRVCCGDWKRVLTPSVAERHGTTAVFLDPPYADTAKRRSALYSQDSDSVAHEVRRWAIEHGDNPKLRIALCGYEGEHTMPDDWECVPWKANGGYGSQRKKTVNTNPRRERLWFSPHCLKPHGTPPQTEVV